MRFLLILTVLVALGVYSCRRLTSGRDEEPKSLIGGLSSKFSGALGTPAAKAISEDGKAGSSGEVESDRFAAMGVRVDRVVVKRYLFGNRVPPPVEWWRRLVDDEGSIDVVVDPVAGIVVVQGDSLGVRRCIEIARMIDVSARGCDVRTWALFVGDSSSKGFDISAELGFGLSNKVFGKMEGGAISGSIPIDRLRLKIDALVEAGSVQVLQCPFVRLTNGEIAQVSTTQEIPVPVTTVAEGVVKTAIEYRSVGLKLDVFPRFLSDGRIRLDVSSKNGVLGDTVVVEGSDVATFEEQLVKTSVEMVVGDSVVLGGVRSVRFSHKTGIFRNVKERSEGLVYVVIATYNASGVIPPFGGRLADVLPSGFEVPGMAVGDGIAPLLPPRGWKGLPWPDELRRAPSVVAPRARRVDVLRGKRRGPLGHPNRR